MRDARQLRGGSYHWWPPQRDHVILYRANAIRFAYFERFVGDWSGLKALDVGCGGGYACEYLARHKAVVSGTDIMEESLHEAQDHASQCNLQIEYRQCTAERLPYEDGVMDLVTCFDVLEHVPDKHATISEINRVLKPGGRLFFDTVNRTFWSRLLIIWLGEVVSRFIPRGTHHWGHFISPPELRGLLEASGFTQVQIAGLRLEGRRGNEGSLPAAVSPRGNTAVMYFGAALKRSD
ncbi:MAG: bifunctional 2-polyprenyl-6-hydroxyphenol methylase/3-demethylubiquinol 3-O-methyltransferase UbiG [Chloroflexi bacterium]|nr:bifunctional 2-polyprenyl-6-hydroxyphenol methylase/3-demethylubiquinol 3-O-methyltransferase UbiG [Chloroflexota bacterium]